MRGKEFAVLAVDSDEARSVESGAKVVTEDDWTVVVGDAAVP